MRVKISTKYMNSSKGMDKSNVFVVTNKGKTSHKSNNKDLSRLWYFSPVVIRLVEVRFCSQLFGTLLSKTPLGTDGSDPEITGGVGEGGGSMHRYNIYDAASD